MVARIQSTLLDSPAGTQVPGTPVLVGVSRDDLRKSYQVELVSVDSASTYEWALEFIPDAPDDTASGATLDLVAFGSFTIVDTTLMVAGDHIKIGGVDLTAVTGSPGGDEFQIVIGDEAATAANAASAINTSINYAVSAVGVGAVVNLAAKSTGTAGNSIALSTHLTNAGAITVSGPNLVGGSDGSSKVVRFNVDYEGPYLVRLTVDKTLPGESTQYIRLRFLTRFADVSLVAGGERRDSVGVIPVDVDVDGWAQEQNKNVQRLLALTRRVSTSGRVLYVDANRGRDKSNTPNDTSNTVSFPGSDPLDPDGSGVSVDTEGFGDFSTISDAQAYALDYASRGEPAPSLEEPFTIYVNPGLYVEDLVLQPNIHIVGLGPSPSQLDVQADVNEVYSFRGGNHVIIRTTSGGGGGHVFSPAGSVATDLTVLENLILENTDLVTTEPVLKHTAGVLVLDRVVISQKGTSSTQGPAYGQITSSSTALVSCFARKSYFRSEATGTDQYAVVIDAPRAHFYALDCSIIGIRAGLAANPSVYSTTQYDTVALENTTVFTQETGLSIRACVGLFQMDRCQVGSVTMDGFGTAAGTRTKEVSLVTRFSSMAALVFDDLASAAVATLSLNASSWLSLSYPTGTPSLGLDVHDYSIRYDNSWVDPETGVPSVPVFQLPVDTVQGAIDILTNTVGFLSQKLVTTVTVATGGVYALEMGIGYVGVDTATPAASISIQLPDLEANGAQDGRRLIIKDEGGGAGVSGQQINVYVNNSIGTIDGVVRNSSTPLVLNTNYTSMTLVCRGESGGTSHWYTV